MYSNSLCLSSSCLIIFRALSLRLFSFNSRFFCSSSLTFKSISFLFCASSLSFSSFSLFLNSFAIWIRSSSFLIKRSPSIFRESSFVPSSFSFDLNSSSLIFILLLSLASLSSQALRYFLSFKILFFSSNFSSLIDLIFSSSLFFL